MIRVVTLGHVVHEGGTVPPGTELSLPDDVAAHLLKNGGAELKSTRDARRKAEERIAKIRAEADAQIAEETARILAEAEEEIAGRSKPKTVEPPKGSDPAKTEKKQGDKHAGNEGGSGPSSPQT